MLKVTVPVTGLPGTTGVTRAVKVSGCAIGHRSRCAHHASGGRRLELDGPDIHRGVDDAQEAALVRRGERRRD